MITMRHILLVFALGSIWGVAELYGTGLLSGIGVGSASLWLAILAIFLLGLGRGVWNKIGSSALMGLVAAAIKFAGPSPHACHLLGIASLGLAYDVFASTLARHEVVSRWRQALAGLLTAFAARAFFVWYAVRIAQTEHWVEGGTQLAIDYVVRGGSVVAAFALVLAPLGFRVGTWLRREPTAATAGKPVAAEHR